MSRQIFKADVQFVPGSPVPHFSSVAVTFLLTHFRISVSVVQVEATCGQEASPSHTESNPGQLCCLGFLAPQQST